jgi:hypothetical protein
MGKHLECVCCLEFQHHRLGDRVFKVKKAKAQHLSLVEQVEQKREMVKKEVLDANESVVQSAKTLESPLSFRKHKNGLTKQQLQNTRRE